MIEVELGLGHAAPACCAMAERLHKQFSNGYTHGVSTRPLTMEFGATARRRAARSRRLGYEFDPVEREHYEDDIFEINNSMPVRQNKPMDPAYAIKQRYHSSVLNCVRHHVYFYGVFLEERLRAYTWMYHCGDMALISTILGHGEHLKDDVMYLLVTGAVQHQVEQMGLDGTLVYNLHRSGTDGLRYFKERLGFAPTDVTWRL